MRQDRRTRRLIRHRAGGRALAAAVAAASAALLGVSAFSVIAAQDARRPLEAIERDLTRLAVGNPVLVPASPALCQPSAAAPRGASDEELKRWYLSEHGCELRALPRLEALVTPFQEDGGAIRFESPADLAHLNELLDELLLAVERGGLSPLRQLILHSTAWEVAFGLNAALSGRPDWQKTGRASMERSLRLLDRTRFSAATLEHLPATLADPVFKAQAPQIAETVLALLRHDPGVLEVVPPTDLHGEILRGRFMARIFITASDPAVREQLRALQGPRVTDEEMRALPRRFAGVRAILALYFNVFRDDDTVVPTGVIAFWHEYSFSGKAVEIPFAEAERRIRFLTIEGEKGTADEPLRYETADQNGMARSFFVDVTPTLPNTPVMTLRAHCLKCHIDEIATFATHGSRQVELTPPLVRAPHEVLTADYQRFAKQFRELKRRYLEPPPAR
jgi:hypothetical protein